jgi:hypothetical protein
VTNSMFKGAKKLDGTNNVRGRQAREAPEASFKSNPDCVVSQASTGKVGKVESNTGT